MLFHNGVVVFFAGAKVVLLRYVFVKLFSPSSYGFVQLSEVCFLYFILINMKFLLKKTQGSAADSDLIVNARL